MRKVVRLGTVILIGVLELTLFVFLLRDYDRQVGEYGFTVKTDGVTISAVEPNLPADRTGITPGDKIVYQSLPLLGRRIIILKEPVPAQAPITFQLIHAGQLRTITLHAQVIPSTFIRIEAIAFALSGFIFGIIGLTLAYFRPSWMTWAFALTAPPMLLPWSILFWSQNTLTIFAAGFDMLVSVLYAMQVAGILIFSSRFPSDNPKGLTLFIDRLSFPVGIFIAAFYLYAIIMVRYTTYILPHWIDIANDATLFASITALIAFIATFITTQGNDRSRLAPTIGSFVLLIVLGALQELIPELTSNANLLFVTNLAFAAATALVAVTVAYGVICQRVMDVDFIIERTLAYSLLTLLLFIILSAIEFLVDKMFENGRLAELVEIIASVLVGLSIVYIHNLLEHLLERWVFRQRYAAEKSLRKTALTIFKASTMAQVDESLVSDPVAALDLASAAVFRQHGNTYVRVAADGWDVDTCAQLTADDPLIVRISKTLKAIDLNNKKWPRQDLPTQLAAPLYAVPVLTGHQLEAVLIYGGHRTGTTLDPDECKILRALAQDASLSYNHLKIKQMRERIEALQLENQALRINPN